MKKSLVVTAIALFFSVFGLSAAFAGEIDLELLKQTETSQTAFGTGSHPASITVYAGDVLFMGTKIGQFTATQTRTTWTGIKGDIMEYDIIVPVGGFNGLDSLGDFISIRTNHIATGVLNPPTVDTGVIYAASAPYKSLMGLTVQMAGTTLKIMY